jgi:hypothetical protein
MATAIEVQFDRDKFARLYANRHLDSDAGVVQILHLPTNAPPSEIRFLEVNKLISETMPPEPIDFGVDVGGADGHTLFVLDVTPSQWVAIQNGEIPLPDGWTLDGKQELARR